MPLARIVAQTAGVALQGFVGAHFFSSGELGNDDDD
jgi:hypothetical protein